MTRRNGLALAAAFALLLLDVLPVAGQTTAAVSCKGNSEFAKSTAVAADALGVALPRPPEGVNAPRPSYTPAAMARRIEGRVQMKAVVEADGSVGAVCVQEPLDPDLDEQAVAALKRWRFEPATRAGRPVAVIIAVNTAFTLQ